MKSAGSRPEILCLDNVVLVCGSKEACAWLCRGERATVLVVQGIDSERMEIRGSTAWLTIAGRLRVVWGCVNYLFGPC